MNKFRKPHGNGGNRGFGGDRPRFGKPSRPPFGGSREESGQKFDAICAHCGKACQVPFQPNGKKPVFCRDCFNIPRGDGPKRDFNPIQRDMPAHNFPPRNDAPRNDNGMADVKKQIDVLTSKVDVIMRMLQDSHRAPAPVVASPKVSVPAMPIKKEVSKKVPAKKSAAKKKGPAKR